MTTTAAEVTTFDPPGGVLGRRGRTAAAGWALIPYGVLTLCWVVNGISVLAVRATVGERAAAALLGGGLVVSAVAYGAYCFYFGDYLPHRSYARRLRGLVGWRPDAVVDPANPAAVFVQVFPASAGKPALRFRPVDVGYLYADEFRRAVYFEGDAERWVIPAGAVVGVATETAAVGIGFAVVLRVRTADGSMIERRIGPGHVFFRPRGLRGRRGEVAWLARQLEAAVGESAAGDE